MLDWIAYQIVMKTPLGKHTWFFLPAAGRWAYRKDNIALDRCRMNPDRCYGYGDGDGPG